MASKVKRMQKNNSALASVGEMDASEVVGNRLYKIRFVAGYGRHGKQLAWARKLGFNKDSYNQWELGRMGKTPIMCPIERAIAICEWSEDGIDLNYIYRGLLRGLGPAWFAPLKDAPNRPGFVPPEPLRRRV